MKIYVAIIGTEHHIDGWYGCLQWAGKQARHMQIVKIHVARAGEKDMRIVAEVTEKGVRLIKDGRVIPIPVSRCRSGKAK